MVPMAPSSTRMRSRAAASRAVRFGETGTFIGSGSFLCATGADAAQLADGEDERGAVNGGEIKRRGAMSCQFWPLAARARPPPQLAGVAGAAEAFKFSREPV